MYGLRSSIGSPKCQVSYYHIRYKGNIWPQTIDDDMFISASLDKVLRLGNGSHLECRYFSTLRLEVHELRSDVVVGDFNEPCSSMTPLGWVINIVFVREGLHEVVAKVASGVVVARLLGLLAFWLAEARIGPQAYLA